MKKRYECDLHCHTDRSDGNDSPIELIANASAASLKAVAIVDHDIDPVLYVRNNGRNEKIREYAKRSGIDLVLGYEFSCDSSADDVHIIGYELDWDFKPLKDEVKRVRSSKTQSYIRLCEVLKDNGCDIDFYKDVLGSGRAESDDHIRDHDSVERKHIFELLALKGYAKSWQEAKLMVRKNPYLNIRRPKINPVDAIKIIKNAGGLSVLAHPYLIDEEVDDSVFGKMTRDKYIENLFRCGLDGIESLYTYEKTSYKGVLSRMEIKKEIEKKYFLKAAFFTGGSDYHNDGAKGVKNQRYIGEAGISYRKLKKYLLLIWYNN
jgi:3',5'-nucleoside bisphosphate phosphatase